MSSWITSEDWDLDLVSIGRNRLCPSYTFHSLLGVGTYSRKSQEKIITLSLDVKVIIVFG